MHWCRNVGVAATHFAGSDTAVRREWHDVLLQTSVATVQDVAQNH